MDENIESSGIGPYMSDESSTDGGTHTAPGPGSTPESPPTATRIRYETKNPPSSATPQAWSRHLGRAYDVLRKWYYVWFFSVGVALAGVFLRPSRLLQENPRTECILSFCAGTALMLVICQNIIVQAVWAFPAIGLIGSILIAIFCLKMNEDGFSVEVTFLDSVLNHVFVQLLCMSFIALCIREYGKWLLTLISYETCLDCSDGIGSCLKNSWNACWKKLQKRKVADRHTVHQFSTLEENPMPTATHTTDLTCCCWKKNVGERANAFLATVVVVILLYYCFWCRWSSFTIAHYLAILIVVVPLFYELVRFMIQQVDLWGGNRSGYKTRHSN